MTLFDALSGVEHASLATTADLYDAKAVLVIGADLSVEQPLLAFQIRANFRHHDARIYTVTPREVREDKSAIKSVRAEGDQLWQALDEMKDVLAAEDEIVVLFDDSIQGRTCSSAWWNSVSRSASL